MIKTLSALIVSWILVTTLFGAEKSVSLESHFPIGSDEAVRSLRPGFSFRAKLKNDEVLTIRVTRWESGKKLLETEEVLRSDADVAAYQVALSEQTTGYWLLSEHGVEQYLQSVKLLSFQPTDAKVELRFASNADPKRVYRFSWSAKVEAWTVVKKRHPQLPELQPGSAWHSKRVISAAALKAPF